jgi:AcrR family transcriptional regulator
VAPRARTTLPAKGKQDYFDAGMDLLGSGGVGAVTIARLCQALGVTKGSFYHHFTGVEDYRTQLLVHWSTEREHQVAAAAEASTDPYERLDLLRDSSVSLHHEAEAAIRAWSRTDADAWQVRATVDAAREHTVAQAFMAVGVPPERAEFFGRLAVVVLVGAQHRAETTDRAELHQMYSWLEEMALATAGQPAPLTPVRTSARGRGGAKK